MNDKTIEEVLEDIPHGHGLSFKKGVSDSLLNIENNTSIPNGHNLSYQKGIELGKLLAIKINKKVRL